MKNIKKKIKKPVSVLLILILMVQLILPITANNVYANDIDNSTSQVAFTHDLIQGEIQENQLRTEEDLINEDEENIDILVKTFEITLIDVDGKQRQFVDGERLEVDVSSLNSATLIYGLEIPDTLDIKDGDTYIIDLPDFFEGSVKEKPIIIKEETIALYDISDGQVIITFNENANKLDEKLINVELSGSFNTKVFETEEEVIIEVSLSEGASFSVTLKAKQQPYIGEDRKSVGHSYVLLDGNKEETNKNPTHVDWTIIVNDNMNSYENATVIDDLGDNLEFVDGSLTVKRIIRNYMNEEIERETVKVPPILTDTGFELELGKIQDAYEISYTTKLIRPDGGGQVKINNNAKIILDDSEKTVTDHIDITWSEDIPIINKTGEIASERQDIIDWQVEYNYGKEDLGTVILKDVLSHGEILPDTIRIYEVDTYIDGNVIPGKEVKITTIEQDIDDEGNLTLINLNAKEKAYKITFSSSVPVGLKDTLITNIISDNLPVPNSDEESVMVNTIPTGGKIGEQKVDDKGYPYIDWTITMNTEKIDVGSITVYDVFSSDHLEFDIANSNLYELKTGDTKVENFTINDYLHEDGRTGFSLEITNAGPNTYKFIYRTYYTIEGMQEPNVANDTELVFLNWDGHGIGEPIELSSATLSGPKAGIRKSGKYEPNEERTNEEIEWEIIFNNSKILLGNPKLKDVFTSNNYEYIEDSIKVLVNNEEFDNYTFIQKDKNGFEIQINEKTNATFTITYRTTADNTNNTTHVNEASLTWLDVNEGPVYAEIKSRNPCIKKVGNVIVDDNGNKSINWSIKFNNNKHFIKDVVITDTYLPSTSTISDVRLFRDGVEIEKSQYRVSPNPPLGEFTVTIDKLDPVEYKLTYTLSLSPEEEMKEIKNTAKINYTGGSQEDTCKINRPKLQIAKRATNLDKDQESPVISWEIRANTDSENHYVNLVDAILTDTIPKDQKLLEDTVKVYRADSSDVEITTDLNINEVNNSFSIDLYNGPSEYIVTFQTKILEYPSSYKEKLDRYTSTTTLTNQSNNESLRSEADASAYQDYFADGSHNKSGKSGSQNSETEDVDWTVIVNPQGLTINNTKIRDTLSDNHTYVQDSSKESVADSIIVMDENGAVLSKESYTLTVADDNRSFELIIGDGRITSPYKLSYSTRLNSELIGTYTVSNTIELKGGEPRKILDNQVISTTTQQWMYGGGGSGRVLSFEIYKETPTGSSLKGAEFTLERIDINKNVIPINTEIITDEDGNAVSGDILAGSYRLTETKAPQGYKKLASPICFTIGYTNPIDYKYNNEDEVLNPYTITITNRRW